MTDLAPSLPPLKALGDWFNSTFLGRSNIRVCFLLEWAMRSFKEAGLSDPLEPRLREERLRECRESLHTAAQFLGKELGISSQMTRKLMNSKETLPLNSGDQGSVEEYIREHAKEKCPNPMSFKGVSNRAEAFINICLALNQLESSQKCEEFIARARFALRPEGREFDLERVSKAMIQEVVGLQPKATIRDIKNAELAELERILESKH